MDAKDEEERRNHNRLQMERFRQKQIQKNEAASKGRDDVSNMKETTEESKNANRKDFSELQQESVTKNILLERLSLEEQNLGNYKF